jgi:preprotein translocase subunit YajC
MVGIFYFVLIRPQQKERKEHDALVAALQKGQKVVTRSGVHGRVSKVGESTVELEIADKVLVTVDKTSVARKGDS